MTETLTAAPPATTGFRHKPRTHEFTCDTVEAAEGFDPFQITVDISLTNAETRAIPFADGVSYATIFATIAPYVLAWNAMARNLETGEWELAPPPAEIGPEAFLLIDESLYDWIILSVKFGRVRARDFPKDGTPSTSGGGPANDTASSSSAAPSSPNGTRTKAARATKSRTAGTS